MTKTQPVAGCSILGAELLKALGLEDQRVAAIALRADGSSLFEVDVTLLLQEHQLAAFTEVVRKFKLVPREEEKLAGEAAT